ncbi:MAG: RNA-binding S4 domain-containing protein [Bacteroidota bacterium]
MEKLTFTLSSEYIELIKLLKMMKLVGSGGEAKIRIEDGEAFRNGEVETRKRAKIKAGEVIVFDEFEIKVLAAEAD